MSHNINQQFVYYNLLSIKQRTRWNVQLNHHKQLKSYIKDKPRDWNLDNDVLEFAYNCQSHTSTILALHYLVFALSTAPIALKPEQSTKKTPEKIKTKWRYVLEKTLSTTGAKPKVGKEHHKRIYVKRFWHDKQHLKLEDRIYLRIKGKNEKETQYLLEMNSHQ